LRIRRGDGLVQLSLDDGRVVKVEKEDQVVRVP
jgi:hypothetical protein